MHAAPQFDDREQREVAWLTVAQRWGKTFLQGE